MGEGGREGEGKRTNQATDKLVDGLLGKSAAKNGELLLLCVDGHHRGVPEPTHVQRALEGSVVAGLSPNPAARELGRGRKRRGWKEGSRGLPKGALAEEVGGGLEQGEGLVAARGARLRDVLQERDEADLS